MKKSILTCVLLVQLAAHAQNYKIPAMPDPAARIAQVKADWTALQQSPPRLGVRDCFLLLLDGLDTRFLKDEQVEWILKKVQSRMISNPLGGKSYGNIFWGWQETGYDIGDGNNIEFCMQYGILIKYFFNDRLSTNARKTLDEIFELGIQGARNQEVRISYTNIFLMKIWNFLSHGEVYHEPAILEEGKKYLDEWLHHVSRYGNREYDSPTYSGVDLESLLLIHTFIKDADVQRKITDVLKFFITDLSSHYLPNAGILGGAHSRDYNRVFSRDLLEEKYFNPLIGRKNTNTHLFHQVCTKALMDLGLSKTQQDLMNQKDRYIIQRWDSLPHTYAADYTANKFSIASSNQAYSPDDKPFAIYLSSKDIPEMPNIAYVMEGRDDHYGTWSADGMGEKMKHLMPPNYPANGGWNKTRHLMPFMQAAQNKSEFVMLVAGEKDHNCIHDYLNSTIILPDYFSEVWMDNQKVSMPTAGADLSMQGAHTLFLRFEDVVIAFRYLWDNTNGTAAPKLVNDGFVFHANREAFQLVHNKAVRLTLQHPNNGKAALAMWWKVAEGIHTAADFAAFRKQVLEAPVSVKEENGTIDIAVQTKAGKLGVKADLVKKKRLAYYYPVPMPKDYLFMVNGKEIGLPIMKKYQSQ
jgi:hypothetical protein